MYIEYIKVEMFEMKKANYPDTLSSGGIGPCIAMGVYDPKTRSGYMVHVPHFEFVSLDRKIQEIKSDYGDLTRLKIFVAGNSLSSHDDAKQREFERSNRSYFEKTLRKYFQASQLQIKWMPDDYEAELFLYTSTGEFELYAQSLDELLE